jgi:hypothetical protein
MTQPMNPQVRVKVDTEPKVQIKVGRNRRVKGLVECFAEATDDLADNFEKLNETLGNREKLSHWERRAANETLRLFSLRRWAFILPGGGAYRGGRIRKARLASSGEVVELDGQQIPPATFRTPPVERVRVKVETESK